MTSLRIGLVALWSKYIDMVMIAFAQSGDCINHSVCFPNSSRRDALVASASRRDLLVGSAGPHWIIHLASADMTSMSLRFCFVTSRLQIRRTKVCFPWGCRDRATFRARFLYSSGTRWVGAGKVTWQRFPLSRAELKNRVTRRSGSGRSECLRCVEVRLSRKGHAARPLSS